MEEISIRERARRALAWCDADGTDAHYEDVRALFEFIRYLTSESMRRKLGERVSALPLHFETRRELVDDIMALLEEAMGSQR
jgi:hypothetical protein